MILPTNHNDRKDRVILVSNRLPVGVRASGDKLEFTHSSGGLATGLKSSHEQGDSLWIGYPGDLKGLTDEMRLELECKFEDMRIVPVHLTAADAARYCQGMSNGVLWPLFHYLLDRIPNHSRDWKSYVKANEHFADVVASKANESDLIWIHDYHLLLLPSLLRKRLPSARIGFFLHIPFPSSDIFQILPWREHVLTGLLGADLIGFHTFGYMHHFAISCLRTLGIEAEIDRIEYDGRTIRLGAYPMGIDAAQFEKIANDPAVIADSKRIRAAHGNAKIILGIDRLDYTKGLPRRLLAVERLLDQRPSLKSKVRFIQLAIPSREDVEEYQRIRADVEQLIGRINGIHATVDGAPIHYIYGSVTREQLVALYMAADVLAVTPLRDGMNLVAKEFVASRADGDGVLVLSEFAGAASELGEALLVNTYDVDGMAAALARALSMPESERRRRMASLRSRVCTRTVHDWANTFLDALGTSREGNAKIATLATVPIAISEITKGLGTHKSLILVLDYDGTLVPFGTSPDLAACDPSLQSLLRRLGQLPATQVHIVSGRTRDGLEAWLGQLPIALHAEHGLWSRVGPAEPWIQNAKPNADWKSRVRPLLQEYLSRVPGCVLEEKSAGFAWHYRGVEPHLGALHAREIRTELVELLAQSPVEVLAGSKVIEIRPTGVNKGIVVRAMVESAGPDALFVAIGDDRTDEDLFAVLPPGSVSFHVGAAPSRAGYRLESPQKVRTLLEQIIAIRSKQQLTVRRDRLAET
ncbi:MAG: bifunctional alpha,alpha-trehalose-phosphate synthase (UDP-forming)/trehalose-phosphatase [Planctomycetes bacterium]|nr:bifunctional alpha,alpha-trehalose-phosphate synthase (UDP-forming)/trehalose-phosphatase [Planctomycetota bacterium]